MLKPIFHCDPKPFALGPGVGLDPHAQFRVGDTNMLVSKNAKICVTPNVNPQRKSMGYRLSWVPNEKCSVGHVHFIFLVSISFALGPFFQWNMDLRQVGGRE